MGSVHSGGLTMAWSTGSWSLVTEEKAEYL